jgi:HEAT repeat protein
MDYISQKSIPLLISKLTTAITASQRGRDQLRYAQRREEIKDELVLRGEAAIAPMIDLMKRRSDDLCLHAAEVLGRMGAEQAVLPLAQILAEPYPYFTRQCAVRALTAINTPDAALAVNIWQGRMGSVRHKVEAYLGGTEDDAQLLKRLGKLAQDHQVSARRVAEAYLLCTSETLSPEAQIRLAQLHLTPDECAYIEAVQAAR